MTVYFWIIGILAVIIFLCNRSILRTLASIIPLALLILPLYLFFGLGWIVLTHTLDTEAENEQWRQEQIDQTGVDPCDAMYSDGPEFLPGIPQSAIDKANSQTWEEHQAELQAMLDDPNSIINRC